MSIPSLNAGELPTGIHLATLEEIEFAFGRQNDHRKALLSGLKKAARMFKEAGVKFILVDGSFVTDKKEPADIDGCWSAAGEVDFTKIDSDFWNFNDIAEFQMKRQNVKEKYRLDFFIAELIEEDSGKPFSEFFQTNRDGYPKGILKIELN